ncbi:hypothetical protein M0R45_026007 [Rubus argutus]|uniref:Uncharacterized protein n=1 Tax=Rubus argutus TaxID=59490 RepID=A0AAW1WZV7_RUBAR
MSKPMGTSLVNCYESKHLTLNTERKYLVNPGNYEENGLFVQKFLAGHILCTIILGLASSCKAASIQIQTAISFTLKPDHHHQAKMAGASPRATILPSPPFSQAVVYKEIPLCLLS